MFRSIPLDAKFDDIQGCFDPLKYIFPSDCKIKISLLEGVEKKRLDAEKLPEEMQDVHVNDLITNQEKGFEIKREDFYRGFSNEVIEKKISAKVDEEKKSILSISPEKEQLYKEELKSRKSKQKKTKVERKLEGEYRREKSGHIKKKDAKSGYIDDMIIYHGEKENEKLFQLRHANENFIVEKVIRILEERGKKKLLKDDLSDVVPGKINGEYISKYKLKFADQNETFDKIKRIFKEYGGELNELHLEPNIPKNKENNVRKKFNIPKDEANIALLDLSLLGSAKNCLAFGKNG
ncbi:MAG: hypothetical protein MUF15_07895, partial [Acidobacteria bacterium]|nr:hypothetical protein [Acidobacteriota bacterium]